ncbi:MAG: methionine--tRNA ligase [Candidatus Omnitrophota bacterium]|nr:methionine--tRNA ligase [Candidatus Omnitrophota bacterium]
MNKFYITTPIYYVNASPHIGHSYTCIAADALARQMRQKLGGGNVWFLTGSDEHGQKIQKAADEAKLSPQEFVDRTVSQFKDLWNKLDISFDDFIRTTESRHIKTVRAALEILFRNGDIYEDKYEGWYCTPCETFWTEGQLSGNCCPDCQRPVERISEVNYFFKLSRYQEWLAGYIEAHPGFIRPEIRRNEVLSFLKLNKLTDLCISRPRERLSWGIELPFSPRHVTYVWFDALINYISAVGEFNANGQYESKWWGADTEVVHLVGKDILRQHAVYWPIMLKALGIRLPDTVFAHGWWMIDESKMSKSRGNVVSPVEMAEKFGIDTYRYFLLRDVPFGLDGNFSQAAIIKRFNGDLANDLGNLVYRTLTMIEKYFQGAVPEMGRLDTQGEKISDSVKAMPGEIDLTGRQNYNFGIMLEGVWGRINMANKYIEETKPWNLAKENKQEELKSFIRLLVEVIRATAEAIYPVMPQTAGLIREQISGSTIKKGQPLFPRIETG